MDDVSLPAGFALDEASSNTQTPPPDMNASGVPAGFELDEDKYGTTGQQIKAGLEGVGRGFAGPAFTAAETELFDVKNKDILGRQKENPVTAGIGEAGGLGLGIYTGTGTAAVMEGAGKLATEAVGLGDLAKDAPIFHKIGSSAVQQAAEMAVLSGSDETHKMLLNDPETSAESAIANVGMSAALGGAGGAFITGAVSPLWSATAGPKVEEVLNGLRAHLNGGSAAILPEQTEAALTKLGIEVAPEIRAGLSGNPDALERFNTLKEVQNKDIVSGIEKLHKDTSDSVMKAIGIDPSAVEVYSENEAGHDLLDTFKKEYKEKYEPIAAKLDERNAKAATIDVKDEARLATMGRILEEGIEKAGTDSPYFKIYQEYGDRILAKDTVGQMDQLKTEINNRVKGLKVGGDYNEINALNNIKDMISDLQEVQIARNALDANAGEVGQKLIDERKLTNQQYSAFAKMSDELTNHLGIGDFKGAGRLATKLTDKISPEQLLNKFSIRNNADFIDFLGQHFPETLTKVRENELKKLVKPAILGAKDGSPVNVKKLSDIINKGMAGQKDYIQSVMPKGAVEAIDAARTLHDAIPNPKSSGTAGWMTKTLAKMPQSALAAVAMLVGHNPVFGYLAGEMAQRLGRHAPDAINLAYLKFLGSNQPIKSEGFKAMVDFIHNTVKGQNLLVKATKSVFESGTKVLTAAQMPSKADTDKLDKLVTKLQAAPNEVMGLQNGHVGHYLPDHQAGLSEVSTRAVQYLQSIKPQPHRLSPLDKEIAVTPAETQRYNRALEIAQQPAIILKHIKDGTLSHTDMQDLGAMYPGLYKDMANKLSNTMTSHLADNEPIPYKTRMGLSLFLGQPLDSTMSPNSMQAIQATYAPKQAPQPQGAQPGKKGTSTLGKDNNTYRTPQQASEAHHSTRK